MKRVLICFLFVLNLHIMIDENFMFHISSSALMAQHMELEGGNYDCEDEEIGWYLSLIPCDGLIVTPDETYAECSWCHQKFSTSEIMDHEYMCPERERQGQNPWGNDGGNSSGSVGGGSGSGSGGSGGSSNGGSSSNGNGGTSYSSTTENQIRHDDYTPTQKEILFALTHPLIASDVGYYQTGSLNITTNAARFSYAFEIKDKFSSYSDLKGDNVGTADAKNAIRHTLWQATITALYGFDIAKEIADAHENNPNADLTIRQFTGSNAFLDADQTIDLLNNQIGRSIGNTSTSCKMDCIMEQILNRFYETGLYTAQRNNQYSYTIILEKLSYEEYSKAVELLKVLNEYGFTPEQWTQRIKN